jgi:protein-tyrosine phosphatase
MKILFVCLGNICRSPTAEGVLLQYLADAGLTHVDVDSAGTGDWHAGNPPDPRTIRHAHARGFDLSALRARVVTRMDFVLFDRIYAMDQANVKALRALAPPEHAHKLSLLLDVLGEPGREVPDPWAGGPEGFEHVLDLCEAACQRIMATVVSPSPAPSTRDAAARPMRTGRAS